MVTLYWADAAGGGEEFVEYTVRVDDPTCAKRPDIRYWFRIHAEPPRFENARIIVRPGEDRAYVGYTIIGEGENQYASPTRIRAVGEDGRAIDWKHQTATGGPADVVAMEGRMVVTPGSRDSGDADYVDASAVRVGEMVTVTFPFETGPVEVLFRVVASG